MPIYHYRCANCGNTEDKIWLTFQSVLTQVASCARCGSNEMIRLSFGLTEQTSMQPDFSGTIEVAGDTTSLADHERTDESVYRRLLSELRNSLTEESRRLLAIVLVLDQMNPDMVYRYTGLAVDEVRANLDELRLLDEQAIPLRETPSIPLAKQLALFEVKSADATELAQNTTVVELSLDSPEQNEPPVSDLPVVQVVDQPLVNVIESSASSARASLWQVNEPNEQQDWVAHTTSQFLATESGWKIVGASRRGKQHAHEGKYREDAFAFGCCNDWHILIVADGAGSAALARVGSQIAATATLDGIKAVLNAFTDEQVTAASARDAVRAGIQRALTELNMHAQERRVELRDLATTLLVLLHKASAGQQLTVSAQIGDGLIAACLGNQLAQELALAMRGQYAGQTQFLTDIPVEDIDRHIYHSELPSDIGLFLVMTDGVAEDFFPTEAELPRLLASLRKAMTVYDDSADERLLDLIGYERRGSFDDRTLVVLTN